MKIKKNKLTEAAKRADSAIDTLNEKPKDSINVNTATEKDLIADMAAGAKEEGKDIDVEAAENEAEKFWDFADIITNPYVSATARPSKIEKVLQTSLETALDQKEAQYVGDYPNVLIYGLAGFGKTAIVEKFCKDHHLNMFECDAKNLDAATVGGIPYPKTDSTGEITQAPIMSKYWDSLNRPNTVLFLDELNRANGRIRGSLLTLINNHKLPTFIDKGNGNVKVTKYYDNILFTVIAINPASDVFPDAEPLDPAMVSRNGAIINQGPDIPQFLSHLTNVYSTILSCDSLSQRLKDKYEGQFNIAKTILNSPNFHFDDADTVRDTFSKSQGDNIYQYLNYRSFMLLLLRTTDGKKSKYIDNLTNSSGFIDEDIKMIKNALASYTDKPTTGNSIFNNKAATPTQKAAASEVMKALQDFANSL